MNDWTESENPECDHKEKVFAQESCMVRKRPLLTIFALCFGNLFSASIASLQSPFFPQEAERKGATATQYGFVFGVYQLAVFFMSPIAGKMVSYIAPRFLLCFGMFVLGFCCILFGLLTFSPGGATFLALAFSIRIVEGIGAAAFTTTSFTIVASEFPEKVGTTFATVGAFFGLGLIAGPSIGGALFEIGGFTLPFAAIGSVVTVYSFVIYRFLPNIQTPEKKERLGLSDTLRFWFHYSSIVPALLITCNFMIIGFNGATLEPHIRQFGLSPSLVGLVFVVPGGVYGVTAPLWGWIGDKWMSPKILCFTGTIMVVLFCIFVGPAPFIPFDTKLWLVLCSLACYGIGSGMIYVCSFSALNRDAKKRGYPNNISTKGLISSMFSTSISLGSFVGPTLGGYLFDTIGYRMSTVVFLSVELSMVCVTAGYLIHEIASRRETKATANEKSQLIESDKSLMK